MSTVTLIGLHIPSTTTKIQGFEAAKRATLEFLETFKQTVDPADREKLACVARTSLRTKVYTELADLLTDIVTDAVLLVQKPEEAIDLHMVEIMHMKHKLDRDTRLIKGLVLDHGSRHPDMPKRLENAFILTANISLEYDKSEINSGFFYSNAEQREAMVTAERAVIDDKVNKIIELKRKVAGVSVYWVLMCAARHTGCTVAHRCVTRQTRALSLSTKRASTLNRSTCWQRRASWHCDVPSAATWSVSCSPVVALQSTV